MRADIRTDQGSSVKTLIKNRTVESWSCPTIAMSQWASVQLFMVIICIGVSRRLFTELHSPRSPNAHLSKHLQYDRTCETATVGVGILRRISLEKGETIHIPELTTAQHASRRAQRSQGVPHALPRRQPRHHVNRNNRRTHHRRPLSYPPR